MKRTTAPLAAIACCAVCSTAFALYSVSDHGTWPKSWPKELEPLRKQSRTLSGPLVPLLHHEIAFTRRDDFEAAWPHILKVKTPGAPVFLRRGPDAMLGTTLKAGVRIHCPPAGTEPRDSLEAPINSANLRERWLGTNFIDLIVDGEVVDLNRIPLPAETPIIDERFKDGRK